MDNSDNYKKDIIKEMLPFAIAFGLLSAYLLAFTVSIIAFPHVIGFAASTAFGNMLIKAIFSLASALSVYGFYKASSPMFSAHGECANDTLSNRPYWK